MSLLSDLSDEQLAKRLQDGEEEALKLLMQRYEPKLLRYGTRFLGGQGDDVLRQAVQDIFISAYENIKGFDTKQRFSPWIYRIAHNAFVDALRHKAKYSLYGFEFDKLMAHSAHEEQYAREKENAEIRVLLEKGLSTLPPAQREIIALYYFEDLGYREIADILRIPVGTVGVRLARARTRLKATLPDASSFDL